MRVADASRPCDSHWRLKGALVAFAPVNAGAMRASGQVLFDGFPHAFVNESRLVSVYLTKCGFATNAFFARARSYRDIAIFNLPGRRGRNIHHREHARRQGAYGCQTNNTNKQQFVSGVLENHSANCSRRTRIPLGIVLKVVACHLKRRI